MNDTLLGIFMVDRSVNNSVGFTKMKKLASKVLVFLIVFSLAFSPLSYVHFAQAADIGNSREFDPVAYNAPVSGNDEFSGAFVYKYPIHVPPGRNGMTPDINLVYNSGDLKNDSPVGYGWSIDVPSIERLNKHGSDVLYDYTDFASSFSGELVKVSTTTYMAETEDGAFYTYEYDSNYWTVHDDSGTQYLFGQNSQARQDNASSTSEIYRWMLEEVRDTNDNYISYEYFKDSGQIYPATTTYTGHDTTDGIFEVVFNRSNNGSAPNTLYHMGFPMETSERVSEIKIYENGEWVRDYDISYVGGDKSQRSLISSIQDTGRDLDTSTTVSKPATTFTYQEGTIGYSKTTGGAWELPVQFYSQVTSDPTLIRLRDVNGDSYPDIIYSAEDEGIPACGGDEKTIYINDTDGTWTKHECDDEWRPPMLVKHANHTFADFGARIFDYNGDLLNDFVWSYASTTGEVVDDWDVYINNASSTDPWSLNSIEIPVPIVFGDTTSADNGTMMVDVNGDGLTDIVRGYHDDDGEDPYELTESVYLNNGSGWDEATSSEWALPWGIMDENPSGEEVFTFASFLDINGDGLNDYIFQHEDNSIGRKIGVNTSDDWTVNPSGYGSLPRDTQGYTYASSGRSDEGVRFFDTNGDRVTDLVRSIGVATSSPSSDVYLGNWGTNGFGAASSYSSVPVGFASNTDVSEHTGIVDINADGMVDILYAEKMSGGLVSETYLSTATPFVDMLTGINTTEGASTTVAYKMSTQYVDGGSNLLNPNLPVAVPTVESIVTDDGLNNEITETFTYENGDYYFSDSFDRRFVGFGLSTKTDSDGNVTKTYFHQGNDSETSTGENDDHISKRGKVYRVEQYDDSTNLYAKTINKWERYDRGSGASLVKLEDSVSSTYDGDADHKDSAQSFVYNDSTGNVTKVTEWGEVSGSDNGTFTDSGTDKFITTISHATSSATTTFYLVSQETIVDNSSNKVRERKIYYDSLSHGSANVGNPTKEEHWEISSTYLDFEKTYNTYGLVTQDKDPRDKATNYIYDSHNLYPATTTNAVSQAVDRYYDYSSGKVKKLVDANGREFETAYDPFDRIKEVKQPDIDTPTTLIAKTTYTYDDDIFPRQVKRVENLDGSTAVDIYSYFDGLNRKVEERIEAEHSNTYKVKDYEYSTRGLLKSESLPLFDTGTSFTGTSSPPTTSLLTNYLYDPLERVTDVGTNIGTTTNAYDQWVLTVTDVMSNTKDFTNDAHGNLTKVVEHEDTNDYTTQYEYNGNKKLTKITDDDSNVRNFTYDGLGNRLTAQDLHGSADATYGTWTYTYDDSGNVTSVVDPKSQTTNYTYDDVSRVLTEDYTGAGGTEISYGYDGCDEGEGRLCSATSTDAVINYDYNAVGLKSGEVKTIESSDYTTTFDYDRQGNISGVIYPDSSEVSYSYNSAGLLETIQQKEFGGSFADVISNFNHAPTDQVRYKVFANDVDSLYTYDSTGLYRLTDIFTAATTSEMAFFRGGGDLFEQPARYVIDKATDYLIVSNSLLALGGFPDDLDTTPGEEIVEEVTIEETSTTTEVVIPEETNFEEEVLGISTTTNETILDGSTSTPDITEEDPSGEVLETSTTTIEISTTTDADSTVDTSTTTSESNLDTATTTDESSGSLEGVSTTTSAIEYEEEAGTSTDMGIIEEFEFTVSTTTATTTATSTPKKIKKEKRVDPVLNAFLAQLKDKTGLEKAGIKSLAISDVVSVGTITRDQYTIEITEINPIEGGLEVFARAWYEDGVQIGFGRDGDVDIERFRVFNPPVLIPDELGAYEREVVDEARGLERAQYYRLDPEEALYQTLEHTISVVARFDDSQIISDKVGNTTSTFYPDAHSETSTVDGRAEEAYGTGSGKVFGTMRGGSGTHSSDSGASGGFASLTSDNGTNKYKNVKRGIFLFDTASIPDDDQVDSATFSIYGASAPQSDFGGDIDIVSSSPASNTSISSSDYAVANYGSTAYSSVAFSSMSNGAYNDFSFNATGESYISLTGITKLGARNSWDVDNNAPTWVSLKNDDISIYFADQSGTTNDPKLVVEHAEPSAGENSGGIQNINLTYDDIGNITKLVNDSDNLATATSTFTYDDLYRLKSASTTDATSTPYSRTYSYNSIGNITNKSDQGSYTYNDDGYNNPHAADSINSVDLSYDNNGNVTDHGSFNYTWDYRNRLTGAEDGTATTTYEYDHNNDRTLKDIDGTDTIFANDYYNKAGATTTRHIFTPGGELVATMEGNGTATSTYYIHSDHLGGQGVTTDSSGDTVELTEYYPYGSQRVTSGDFEGQRKYTGHEYDTEADLTFAGARYYDQDTGRWLSQDPVFLNLPNDPRTEQALRDPQMQNSYSYARNNPLKLVDKEGEFVNVAVGALGGGVISAGAQGISDLISGNYSGYQEYAGAFVGGAIVGGTIAGTGGLSLLGTVMLGGTAGAVDGAVAEGLKVVDGTQDSINTGNIAEKTFIGGFTAGIPGLKVKGITAGRGSFESIKNQINTKFINGTINSIRPSTAGKIFGAQFFNSVPSESFSVTLQQISSRLDSIQKSLNKIEDKNND